MFQATMAALFRRHGPERDGYEPIPRCEEEEEEHGAAPAREEEEEGRRRLGPEARGHRFIARAHRRSGASSRWFASLFRHQTSSIAVADDLREVALSYVLAKKWEKAAVAYGVQAAHALKGGSPRDRLDAASALLDSARCYMKILHKDKGQVAATKSALKKAFLLFMEGND